MMTSQSSQVNHHARIKVVRGATKIVVPERFHSREKEVWREVNFLNPIDTNLVVAAGVAENASKVMIEQHIWYHQIIFVLDGELVLQDLDTGGVYHGRKGDLFYWGPDLRFRLGGTFRAYFVRTPPAVRWMKTSKGMERIEVLNVKDEYIFPGAPPEQVRKNLGSRKHVSPHPSLKFVKGASDSPSANVDSMDTSGVVKDSSSFAGVLVNPVDSDLVLEAEIAEHKSNDAVECDHRWHQMVLILGGEMTSEDLDTGEEFRAGEGDFIYWAPGLWHTGGGRFRVLAVTAPPARRWVRTPQGVEKLYMVRFRDEILTPGSPPDEIRKEPLTQVL